MDTFYRGLAAPQQTFALGRPDMADSDRPGAILAGLVNEALLSGAFEPRPRERAPSPASTPAAWSPAYVERRDFGAFDDEDALSDDAYGH